MSAKLKSLAYPGQFCYNTLNDNFQPKQIRQFNPQKPLTAPNGIEVYPVTVPIYNQGEQTGASYTVFVASNGATSVRGTCLQSLSAKLNLAQAQCQDMLAKAKEQSKQVAKTASDESERVRNRLAGDLRDALRRMES